MNTIIVAKYVTTITLVCALFGTGSSERVLDNSEATTNRVEFTGGTVPIQASEARPIPTLILTRSKRASPDCLVPRQPKNGQWKLHRYLCESGVNCDIPQGTSLKAGSQLVYTCAAGYMIRGNTDVFCGPRGNWSAIPACVETRCPSLNSASTMTNCTRLGEWTSCDSPVLSKTRAKVSCRVGYRMDNSSIITRREMVECNNFGRWDPDPIKCVPGSLTVYVRIDGEIVRVLAKVAENATDINLVDVTNNKVIVYTGGPNKVPNDNPNINVRFETPVTKKPTSSQTAPTWTWS